VRAAFQCERERRTIGAAVRGVIILHASQAGLSRRHRLRRTRRHVGALDWWRQQIDAKRVNSRRRRAGSTTGHETPTHCRVRVSRLLSRHAEEEVSGFAQDSLLSTATVPTRHYTPLYNNCIMQYMSSIDVCTLSFSDRMRYT
jgi:hypothetical protein